MDIAVWTLGTAAALTALGVIWRKGIKPAVRFISRLVHIADALIEVTPHLRRLPDTLPVLTEIAMEFRPNGGASLRDSINRIEHTVKTDSLRLDQVSARLDKITAVLD